MAVRRPVADGAATGTGVVVGDEQERRRAAAVAFSHRDRNVGSFAGPVAAISTPESTMLAKTGPTAATQRASGYEDNPSIRSAAINGTTHRSG